MRDIRVLLIAENASPELTSVPLEGWCHARAICEHVDGHLVTQIRNLPAISRAGWELGKQFTCIDTEPLVGPIYRMGMMLRGGKGTGWTTTAALSVIGNYYFEHLIWKRFREDFRAGRFDLVHRLIPLSPTAPSLIAGKLRRLGIPFVMGPLNGGLPWPREFESARRREKEWLSYVRGLHKFLPGYSATRRNSNAIIVGSMATLSQIPSKFLEKCVYIPENAIAPERFSQVTDRPSALPLRVVFVGRMVPYKGPDLLLEAATPLLREGLISLRFLGDGPLKEDLRKRIERENIPHVELAGWIPHEKLQEHLVNSDVFAFPSIREFGGAVVLEAMSMRCVPIVVDYGGPGELVTPSTGFKVPLGSRQSILDEFRRILTSLTQDLQQVDRLRAIARERVFSKFTWDVKAQQVVSVYREVLAKQGIKENLSKLHRENMKRYDVELS